MMLDCIMIIKGLTHSLLLKTKNIAYVNDGNEVVDSCRKRVRRMQYKRCKQSKLNKKTNARIEKTW